MRLAASLIDKLPKMERLCPASRLQRGSPLRQCSFLCPCAHRSCFLHVKISHKCSSRIELLALLKPFPVLISLLLSKLYCVLIRRIALIPSSTSCQILEPPRRLVLHVHYARRVQRPIRAAVGELFVSRSQEPCAYIRLHQATEKSTGTEKL